MSFLSYDQADEDYIDMEISSFSKFFSLSSPPQTREFEFQMSSSSAEREPTNSPADELFYKGKLLPLHLPPRLQMVEKLLQSLVRLAESWILGSISRIHQKCVALLVKTPKSHGPESSSWLSNPHLAQNWRLLELIWKGYLANLVTQMSPVKQRQRLRMKILFPRQKGICINTRKQPRQIQEEKFWRKSIRFQQLQWGVLTVKR